MNLVNLIKGLLPILLPLGEQGINQLFEMIEAEVKKMSDSNDLKQLAVCLLPGLKQFAIIELNKLK